MTQYERYLAFIIVPLYVFHALILLQLIPYQYVWGSRLTSEQEMYLCELVSVTALSLLSLLLLARMKQRPKPTTTQGAKKAINAGLWCFVALFALNTLGNLLAETYLEKTFSVITFAMCWLIYKVIKQPTRHLS